MRIASTDRKASPPVVRLALCASRAFTAAALVFFSTSAFAAKGDCGQPISNGDTPLASDALGVLRAAVNISNCELSVCDTDDNGSITAGDALRVLRLSVGQNVTLNCPSAGSDIQCSTDSGSLTLTSPLFNTPMELRGDLTLRCDDPAAGGDCECVVENIEPIAFGSSGVICASATDTCSGGSLDCDGGTGRQTELAGDHTIGTCASNAACEASCATHCAGLGKSYFSSGCEGHCASGTNADAACTGSVSCPGSYCIGYPSTHGNQCGCHCEGPTGSAAPDGHFRCRVGLHLSFEVAGPCGDGDEIFPIGDQCLALSSESVTATIEHANNGDDPISTTSADGATQTCSELGSGGSEGLSLVGIVPIPDSPLGDIFGVIEFPCE